MNKGWTNVFAPILLGTASTALINRDYDGKAINCSVLYLCVVIAAVDVCCKSPAVRDAAPSSQRGTVQAGIDIKFTPQ